MSELIKTLWISDAVAQTGFWRVSESILKYLPENKYDIDILGVNFYGDYHEYPYRIYPAATGGDLYGLNRLKNMCDKIKPDLIYIINDAWVVQNYLDTIKKVYDGKDLPKIVVYFPVDARFHSKSWYRDFDITTPVVYNTFGWDVAREASPDTNFRIIGHGVDSSDFYKIDIQKEEVKKLVYPNKDEFYNSFIVLSVQRNQPRKKLDISILAFSLFSKGKPENVKYYAHCGLQDSSINVEELAKRYGIDKRVILTSKIGGIQQVSKERLNLIYNATDIGLNSSLGEGFSLGNAEHAITGAPQIVADHSALHDLYKDCGLLIPTYSDLLLDNIMTVGRLVRAEDLAEGMEKLYSDKELYNDLSKKSIEKFTDEKFSWKYIASQWDSLFSEVLNK